jgi:hypothetical protein
MASGERSPKGEDLRRRRRLPPKIRIGRRREDVEESEAETIEKS